MKLGRLTAILCAVAIIAVGMGNAEAASTHDVIGTRFQEQVEYLERLGVVQGRPGGFFPFEQITRAEAVVIIVNMLDQDELADMLKGALTFPDVSTTHWASGYILAAKNLGILSGFPDGTFRPEAKVTYAQFAKMLVEASGLQADERFPWPFNYVSPATSAGILENVTFSADAPAIRGDCAIMGAQTVRDVQDPVTGKTIAQRVFREKIVDSLVIEPANPRASVGEGVLLTARAQDEDGDLLSDVSITFSTNDPMRSRVDSTGLFSATSPGTYLVTARFGQLTATADITIYGSPDALRATASPSTVVANGNATTTITVEVVDKRGSRVIGADNEITLAHDDDNGAVMLPATTTVEASKGMAKFTLTSTVNWDVTDKLVVTSPGLDRDYFEVRTTEPVAKSMILTAEPAKLPANESVPGTVTAEILDQTGQPMPYGTHYVTFSITGDGFLEGQTDDVTVGTVGQKATVGVSSEAGDPGSFRITARAEGMGTRTVTVSTYMSGEPKSLSVSEVDVKGIAGEPDSMRILVGLVDSRGRPAVTDEYFDVEFVTPEGSGLNLSGLFFGPDEPHHSVVFSGEKSGTWKVTVRDTNTSMPLVSADTFTCTVDATNIESIALTPSGDPIVYVPVGKPRAKITAQLQDAFGNPVKKSGVKIEFSATISGTGKDVTWSASNGRVTTNSMGQATITMIGHTYTDNSYTVHAGADLDGDGVYNDAVGETAPDGIYVSDVVPSDLTITFRDDIIGDPVTFLEADDNKEAFCTIKLFDANDYPIETQDLEVEVTFSNEGRNVLADSVAARGGTTWVSGLGEDYIYRFRADSSGEVVFVFQGGLAGSFSLTAKSLNSVPAFSRSKTFRITGGIDPVGPRILKTDNTLATNMNFAADKEIMLRVALIDHGGNPVGAPNLTTIHFAPRGTGFYRLTRGGATITKLDLPKGAAYRTIYYIDGAEAVDLDLSFNAHY